MNRTLLAIPLCALSLASFPAAAQIPQPSARGDVEVGGNPAATRGLPFIENDYAGALALARAEHKLLFVDAWATWCHTCLSMKRFVLPDPGMLPVRAAVVWLSIETEAPASRAFVEKYPIDGLPTFFLIDPVREQVVAVHLGSGTVNELRDFVRTNARSYGAGDGAAPPDAAAQATHDGDRARQQDDKVAAARAYRRAVSLSVRDDAMRPERLVLLATALSRLQTPRAARECVQLGLANLDRTGSSAVAADFAAGVAECASALAAPKHPTPADAALAAQARRAAARRLAALTADAQAPLSVDDRSDALANLADLQDREGEHSAAVATMRRRALLLDAAAQSAPDATMASTFDAHRTDTWLYLGEPAKAAAMLTEREQQLPGDYNPPARLARVLFEEKQYAPAEAAIDRALERMTQGPRRVGILALKAQILAAEGKPAEPVLREELDVLRALPQGQRRPGAEKTLEAELIAVRNL